MIALNEAVESLAYAPGQGGGGIPAPHDSTTPFDGARVTSKSRNWKPNQFSGDYAAEVSLQMLSSRMRDLIRNEPILNRALIEMSSLVIGSGILTSAAATTADSEYIDEFNELSDRWFDRWAEGECDYHGRYNLGEMHRVMFEEAAVVGNSLAIETLINDRSRSNPLSYKLVEWDQVARERDTIGDPLVRQNRIQNGIEYSRDGRILAYHIYDYHPHNNAVGNENISRVPASRVIHYRRTSRPSATVGTSWFSGVMITARDYDRFWANHLTKSNMSALLMFALKTDRARDMGLDVSVDGELPGIELGYGTQTTIGTNESIEVVQSDAASAEVCEVMEGLICRIAMGVGLSEDGIKSSAKDGNMASKKANRESDSRRMEQIQGHFNAQVALPMRRRHNELAVALGRYGSVLTASMFRNSPWQWQQFHADAITKAFDITPKEESDATTTKLRTGMTDFMVECRQRGIRPAVRLRNMRWTNERSAAEGVLIDMSAGNGGLAPATTTDAGAVERQMQQQVAAPPVGG